ncbi:MAG: WYL domain-containing protein [Lachnospiraceae bacterium]|nr:WYL domain-containing protein [Lachnospiraceae bacterium]
MARTGNQKLKLLRLMDILLNRTDEQHPLSTQQLIDALAQYGIDAERKSIYSDLEELTFYGLDIIKCGGKKNQGYYVGARTFELAELKLLVDAISASKFISEKKTRELIRKLSQLTSSYDAAKLDRQVCVANRVKTVNEQVLYQIDAIHMALQNKKMISFQYMEWNASKRLMVRRDGALYKISPKTLLWDDENYYLVAWDPEAGICKHFRVDKMKNITVLDEDAKNPEIEIDPALYSKRMFGMFGGKLQDVTIRCPMNRIGILIDRFGKEINIRADGLDHCLVRTQIAVSNHFFGWLCGLGGEFEIVSPAEVAEEYKEHLLSLINKINGTKAGE